MAILPSPFYPRLRNCPCHFKCKRWGQLLPFYTNITSSCLAMNFILCINNCCCCDRLKCVIVIMLYCVTVAVLVILFEIFCCSKHVKLLNLLAFWHQMFVNDGIVSVRVRPANFDIFLNFAQLLHNYIYTSFDRYMYIWMCSVYFECTFWILGIFWMGLSRPWNLICKIFDLFKHFIINYCKC